MFRRAAPIALTIALSAVVLPFVGCNHETHDPSTLFWAKRNTVPEYAHSVARGIGSLSYTAGVHGKVYVRDLTRQQTMSFAVRKNQELVLDPAAGTVTVGGYVTKVALDAASEYELFFAEIHQDPA